MTRSYYPAFLEPKPDKEPVNSEALFPHAVDFYRAGGHLSPIDWMGMPAWVRHILIRAKAKADRERRVEILAELSDMGEDAAARNVVEQAFNLLESKRKP